MLTYSGRKADPIISSLEIHNTSKASDRTSLGMPLYPLTLQNKQLPAIKVPKTFTISHHCGFVDSAAPCQSDAALIRQG
jgi:hypothetical protein